MSRPFPLSSPAALACLVVAAVGCASGSGGGGAVYSAEFPSQRDLERLENAPTPAAVFDSDLRRAPEWVIQASVPDRIEARPWLERSAWGELLDGVLQSSGEGVVPTEAMHCVASELARFALERGGRPDVSVRRFMVAGCNASVAGVSFRSLEGEVGSAESDDALFARWREQALALVQGEIGSAPRSVVGIGFARRGERAALYVASGRRLVELEPLETRLSRGRSLELRGVVLGPADSITAAVNRGRYGFALCEPVGRATLPAFHFACEPDPGDESAWISLSFTPPNRVLGKRALNVLAWPRGGAERIHRRVEYTRSHPVADASRVAEIFADQLNEVRARAGLRPVTLDAAQSATATRVAPHYFAASVSAESEQLADQVALGLLAGWDVEGDIRTGGFTSAAVPETNDLAVLLADTLSDPMARMTLLDPDADRLAVGPLVAHAGEVPVLAAVVTSYSLFREGAKDAEADALFARLTQERLRRELPPPYRLARVWMDAMHSADEVGRGETPRYALDDLLESSVATLSQEVLGWYGETSEIVEFEFPEDLTSAPRLGTAIGVSHRVEPGEAWGRYVVVIVAVDR